MAPRHLAHDRGIPPRRLDHNVARLLGDHGVVAAHDSGEAHRLFRVADYEIFGGQLAIHAVESLERLPRASHAHDDLSAFEEVSIEDVRGLADLPENIV